MTLNSRGKSVRLTSCPLQASHPAGTTVLRRGTIMPVGIDCTSLMKTDETVPSSLNMYCAHWQSSAGSFRNTASNRSHSELVADGTVAQSSDGRNGSGIVSPFLN